MIHAYEARAVRDAEQPLLEAGVPLMARASGALALATIRLMGGAYGRRVLVLAGPGNNGGDALYAGAYLARRGAQVAAYAPTTCHEAARADALAAGVRFVSDYPAQAERSHVWIDGFSGIGSAPGLREPFSSVVSRLEELRAGQRVVAVDVPSGVSSDDAEAPGPILRADLTVAMGAAKPALFLQPARRYAGRIEVVDLGLRLGEPALVSLEPSDLPSLLPPPGPDDHKYTRGVVGLRAGSPRYPGAAILAAEAALAAGPGMLRYAGPQAVAEAVLLRCPEAVVAPGSADSWVIGPGLAGQELEEARVEVEQMRAQGWPVPVVLDAGAVQFAAEGACERVVLTPHPGELSALFALLGQEISASSIAACPLRYVRQAAQLTGAVVLLKGAVDVAVGPASGPAYAQAGPHWRATAGAGDVLAGILGTVLARRSLAGQARTARPAAPNATLAAAIAACLHAAACPDRPMRASEIARRIPTCLVAH